MTALGDGADVVVVGGGLAGFTAVRELRRRGHAGTLTVVDPQGLPYDRPPLSKDYLTGDTEAHRLLLAPPAWFEEHDVELVADRAVRLETGTALAPRHRVHLDSGRVLAADVVVLAQGGRPRPLGVPGEDHPDVVVLRTRRDADRLRERLAFGTRVVVVGGGLTGSEVASSARAALADVTLVTSTDTPSAAAVGPTLAARLHRLHGEHGVTVEVGRVARLTHVADRPAPHRVHLADGRELEAEVLVVAAGTVPDTALAEEAGLEVSDGVLVDAEGRTSMPGVYAVGDVARRRDAPWPPARHWEPAMLAGAAAASALLGEDVPEPGAPWFWSDRHDVHLEAVGEMALPDGGRHVDRLVRGTVVASFALDDAGRLRGAASVDDPATVKAARRIIDRGILVDPDALADPTVSLRALARA